ncbi:MAG: hypothetical protein IT272_01700 [Chitinophagales bacterium]|jgi:protein TonB|nr:hypothetical protein [Sphingobacteriales bacterium]MBP9142792.1 hypothetical protein [Chitinophagales bacterium]MCC7056107.1 hypothetical protein [Chitinophagales bacterium]
MNTTTPASNTPLPAAPEQKISPEALAATLLWHLLLLLIFAFLFKFQLPTKNEEGGVALNFGFENETGFGNEQPFIDMPVANAQRNITAADIAANQQMPAAQTNTTITENPMQNEELLNSNEPEAPVLPSATPQPSKTKPATENQPNEDQPANNNSNTPPPNNTNTQGSSTNNTNNNAPANPELEAGSLFQSKKGKKTGSQGNTPGKTGDEGSPMGNSNIPRAGSNSNGIGTGDIGFNLGGRELTTSPPISDDSQEVGTLVLRIRVDRQGNVIDAQYNSQGSTYISGGLVAKAITAAKKAKFSPSADAPEIQMGSFTFKFRVK